MNDLKTLTHAWLEAKETEAKANAVRLGIESQITALLPAAGAEDATKAEVDGYRVKVQYKVTRSVDSDKLQAMWPLLTEKTQAAFSWKASVKTAELRKVQEFLPQDYATVAAAIETKPAKPAVTIEAVEKEAA